LPEGAAPRAKPGKRGKTAEVPATAALLPGLFLPPYVSAALFAFFTG